MDNPVLLAAIVGACASLVGATIGGIVSYQVAKLQFNAHVTQTYRKEWIYQFREVITDLRASGIDMAHLAGWKKWTEKEFLRVYDNITLHLLRLSLLVRPRKDNELRDVVFPFVERAKDLALSNAKDKRQAIDEWTQFLTKVTAISSKILQAESEKLEGQLGFLNTLAKKWPVWLIVTLLVSINIWVWFQ